NWRICRKMQLTNNLLLSSSATVGLWSGAIEFTFSTNDLMIRLRLDTSHSDANIISANFGGFFFGSYSSSLIKLVNAYESRRWTSFDDRISLWVDISRSSGGNVFIEPWEV